MEAIKSCAPELKALRYATTLDLTRAFTSMDEISFARARHVVTETSRTLAASDALAQGDFVRFGQFTSFGVSHPCQTHE